MLIRKALILALGLWSVAATAQPEAGSNELVLTLYNQVEFLQQEVQTLRGMVEEQANQLRRMQTEQRDRYIDIDRRLSEMSGAAASTAPAALPGTTPAVTAPVVTPSLNATAPGNNPAAQPPTTPPGVRVDAAAAETPPAPAATAPQTTDVQMNEQDLYRTALNLLLEQSQYEESIRLFQNYIDRFPQGRLLTNAYYWQGEALILVSRFNEAGDVFTRLITQYPQDPKAAGAMLKLGVVYRQMGNEAQAQQTWRDISAKYPENVTEIRAAQDYLNRQ